jgi:rRNA-processing protein FCF1
MIKAVIDAGPLFSFLVANTNVLALDRGLRPKHTNVLKESFRPEAAQRELLNVIGSIPEKLTTSHVIGEIQGLTAKLRLSGNDLVSFWVTSIDLLRQWKLDEQLIRLLDLATDERLATLGRIGPPDTGVIQLAVQENCPLITEDGRSLFSEALTAHVDCRLLEHLIPARF